MRALIFRNAELTVDEIADPEPDDGQVLVKTLAAGICGSDVHILEPAAKAPGTRVCSVPIATRQGVPRCWGPHLSDPAVSPSAWC